MDAYSFNDECRKSWDTMWKEYDDFFYDNPDIANKYGLIMVLDEIPIGHISCDPRHRPDYIEIGHILLQEAMRRIKEYKDIKKIIVSTNKVLVLA